MKGFWWVQIINYYYSLEITNEWFQLLMHLWHRRAIVHRKNTPSSQHGYYTKLHPSTLKGTLQSILKNLKSKSHISLSLYLKSRKNYIIRNVDKKPSPLSLVISFRCLDPSLIMAIILISAPLQSRLLLHTRVGSRSPAQRIKWNSPQRSHCIEPSNCVHLIPFSRVAHARNCLLKTIS